MMPPMKPTISLMRLTSTRVIMKIKYLDATACNARSNAHNCVSGCLGSSWVTDKI